MTFLSKTLWQVIVYLPFIFFALPVLFWFFNPYSTLIEKVRLIAPTKVLTFQNYLDEVSFTALCLSISGFCTVVYSLVLILLKEKKRYFLNFSKEFLQYYLFAKSFYEFIVLCLLSLVIISIWVVKATNFPITTDEANVFMTFIAHGLPVAGVYYPIPSNHVLHTFSMQLTYLLLPIQTELALRLPSIVAMTLTGWFMHGLFRQWVHYSVSLLIIGAIWTSSVGFSYGFLARGYAFVLLFSTLSLIMLLESGRNERPYNNAYALWWVVFSILGLLSVPTYVYSILVQVIVCFFHLILSKKLNELKEVIKKLIIILTLTLLIYLPIIIFNSNLIKLLNLDNYNIYSSYIPFIYLFDFIRELGFPFLEFSVIFFLLIIILSLFFRLTAKILLKENSVNVWLLDFGLFNLMLMVFIVPYIQRFYPPQKFLIHGLLYSAVNLSIIINFLNKLILYSKIKLIFFGLSITFLILTTIYQTGFNDNLNMSFRYDRAAHQLYDKLIAQNIDPKTVLSEQDDYNTIFRYRSGNYYQNNTIIKYRLKVRNSFCETQEKQPIVIVDNYVYVVPTRDQ